jgi:hypothetical protein
MPFSAAAIPAPLADVVDRILLAMIIPTCRFFSVCLVLGVNSSQDWMLIFCSFYLFKAPVTYINLLGYVFCCSGVSG